MLTTDRRVLNGIVWVLCSGAPWRDLPETYGPRTTCYNRFVRRRQAGIWDQRILARIDRLAIPGLSHIGRPGLEGTRELVEAPYIMVYMVDQPADEIVVLAIVHSARDQ